MEIITSRSNPLCTHIRKLASSRSYRERQGQFLCDSPVSYTHLRAHETKAISYCVFCL